MTRPVTLDALVSLHVLDRYQTPSGVLYLIEKIFHPKFFHHSDGVIF